MTVSGRVAIEYDLSDDGLSAALVVYSIDGYRLNDDHVAMAMVEFFKSRVAFMEGPAATESIH